jgi:RNA polymerase sigma-70 factor (ECF subfamily)
LQERRKALKLHQSVNVPSTDEPENSNDPIENMASATNSELEAIWDEEWDRHLVQTALNRIKRQVRPRQYEIYYLHVVLGKPLQEVKKALQVSSAQVYLAKYRVGACLHRTVKRLQAGTLGFR